MRTWIADSKVARPMPSQLFLVRRFTNRGRMPVDRRRLIPPATTVYNVNTSQPGAIGPLQEQRCERKWAPTQLGEDWAARFYRKKSSLRTSRKKAWLACCRTGARLSTAIPVPPQPSSAFPCFVAGRGCAVGATGAPQSVISYQPYRPRGGQYRSPGCPSAPWFQAAAAGNQGTNPPSAVRSACLVLLRSLR